MFVNILAGGCVANGRHQAEGEKLFSWEKKPYKTTVIWVRQNEICGKKNAKCSKCTKVNMWLNSHVLLYFQKNLYQILLFGACSTCCCDQHVAHPTSISMDSFSSTWECLQPFTLLFTAHWTSGRGEIWRWPNHIFLQDIFWWEARNSWTFKFSTCRKTNGLQSWRSLGNQFKRVSQIVPSHFWKRTAIATNFDEGR